jgi:hypothetical protein
MTAEDVKLIGELLIPAMRDALRNDLKDLCTKFKEALAAAADEQRKINEDHGQRLDKLEGNQRKAILVYGGMFAAAGALVSLLWSYAKEKITSWVKGR